MKNIDELMEFVTAENLDSLINKKFRGECYNTEALSQ